MTTLPLFVSGLIITVFVALMLLGYSIWLLGFGGRPVGASAPAKIRMPLDTLAEQGKQFSGIIATPFDNSQVNLREQAGVSRRVRCVISYKARVRTLGELMMLGTTQEKWLTVEVVDQGAGGDGSCPVGHKGWAYGKVLLAIP